MSNSVVQTKSCHAVCLKFVTMLKCTDSAANVYKPLHQSIEVTPPLRATVWVGCVKYSTLGVRRAQALHFTNISFKHYQVCSCSPSLFHDTTGMCLHHLKHQLKSRDTLFTLK